MTPDSAPADSPADDLFARLAAQVKPDQSFGLLVKIRLPAGTQARFAAEAAKAAKATAAEPGCDQYSFFADTDEPGTIVLVEKWQRTAALKSHFEQPHFASLVGLLQEIGGEAEIHVLVPLAG
ncbi:MAG TPA: antibiotic biosynthesis monooxygenase [Pirellulales bacterium]|nr:antibiotic biosynthesis monooxygenase [Pirellulales bacterium]